MGASIFSKTIQILHSTPSTVVAPSPPGHEDATYHRRAMLTCFGWRQWMQKPNHPWQPFHCCSSDELHSIYILIWTYREYILYIFLSVQELFHLNSSWQAISPS